MTEIIKITKSDGKPYSVRRDRHRYFFPGEWEKFIKVVTNKKNKLMFETLLHTGARIMEALHLKPSYFDFVRGTVTFKVVKQRKAKKTFYATGNNRTFFVSQLYLKKVMQYLKKAKVDPEQYIFLDNSKLPDNYDELSNIDKKPYYRGLSVNYSQIFKVRLKKAGIEDYKNFSLHNIRKTYGNWMRTYETIQMAELCYRMGHDMDTYLAHYGSSLIFTSIEREEIRRIMGEVK